MSNQNLFDAALAHIRKQGCQAGSTNNCGNFSCKYRDDDGNGCAFAPAIKTYHPDLECRLADELILDYKERLHDWAANCDPQIAKNIQHCHDSYDDENDGDFVKYFETKMQTVAQRHGLVYV